MTVLLPHNTVLSEMYREQREILKALPVSENSAAFNWRRFLPLCCFLPANGESLESWKMQITECRILPPVMRRDCVAYPVDIPGIPDLVITAAVSASVSVRAEPPEVWQFAGDFPVRTLRVFRLCEMTFLESDAPKKNCAGTVSRWTIDRTVWVRMEKR
jgi:hypothetical protein